MTCDYLRAARQVILQTSHLLGVVDPDLWFKLNCLLHFTYISITHKLNVNTMGCDTQPLKGIVAIFILFNRIRYALRCIKKSGKRIIDVFVECSIFSYCP